MRQVHRVVWPPDAASSWNLAGNPIMCTGWSISIWHDPTLTGTGYSVLINNLTTASVRRARNRLPEHFAAFYKKPQFWHRAYFVGSVGDATLETVRAYVDAQGTEEQARKAVA